MTKSWPKFCADFMMNEIEPRGRNVAPLVAGVVASLVYHGYLTRAEARAFLDIRKANEKVPGDTDAANRGRVLHLR